MTKRVARGRIVSGGRDQRERVQRMGVKPLSSVLGYPVSVVSQANKGQGQSEDGFLVASKEQHRFRQPCLWFSSLIFIELRILGFAAAVGARCSVTSLNWIHMFSSNVRSIAPGDRNCGQ